MPEEEYKIPDWLKNSIDDLMVKHNGELAYEYDYNLEDVSREEWITAFGHAMTTAGKIQASSHYSQILDFLKRYELNMFPKDKKEINESYKKIFTEKHIRKYLSMLDKFDHAPLDLQEGFKEGIENAKCIYENYLAFILLTTNSKEKKPKYQDIKIDRDIGLN